MNVRPCRSVKVAKSTRGAALFPFPPVQRTSYKYAYILEIVLHVNDHVSSRPRAPSKRIVVPLPVSISISRLNRRVLPERSVLASRPGGCGCELCCPSIESFIGSARKASQIYEPCRVILVTSGEGLAGSRFGAFLSRLNSRARLTRLNCSLC